MDQFLSSLLSRQAMALPNPGAGQEWSAQVPANQVWLIKTITAVCAYTTGGTGPIPVLILDDGANIFAEAVGAASAPATNTTVTYTWASNMVISALQGAGADVHAQAPLPLGQNCLLMPGWRARSHTINMSASITWSSIVLYVVVNTVSTDFAPAMGERESTQVTDAVALLRS